MKDFAEFVRMYHDIIFFFLALSVCFWLSSFYDKRRNIFRTFERIGVLGPSPYFWSGSSFEYLQDPINAIEKWRKEYGNVFGYFYGPRPYLVVCNLAMIREVLIRQFSNFTDRPDMPVPAKPVVDSLVHLEGKQWRHVRKTLSPAFTGAKIKLMGTHMNNSIDVLLEVMGEKTGQTIDMYEAAQGLTMDVICKCSLAMNVDCIRNPEEKILVSTREYMNNALNNAVKLAIMFPALGQIMGYLYNLLSAGHFTRKICENLFKVIKYRKENKDSKRVDILQLMIQAESESGAYLAEKEIVGSCFAFLVAGYETTANALGYTFYLLAKHQDIQDKLFEEVKHLEPSPSYDEIRAIGLLDQVLNESLRLYPPVVTFVSRKAACDVTIGNYKVPAGVSVQVPIYQIHRDPVFWPEPEKFDPRRFEAKNKASIPSMAFLPFGDGLRNCIGSRFAMFEAKLTIARVVQKFKLVYSNETEDPPTIIVPTVTANPKNGIKLQAIPR